MKLPPPRFMLMVDFICAFSGGIVYFALFDFLLTILGIPHWMVMVQLLTNNAYGVFGVVLLVCRKEHSPLFRFLITMNFVYALFCFAFVVFLVTRNVLLGSWLLLSEGIFIFLLATLEKRSLQSVAEARTLL